MPADMARQRPEQRPVVALAGAVDQPAERQIEGEDHGDAQADELGGGAGDPGQGDAGHGGEQGQATGGQAVIGHGDGPRESQASVTATA